MNLQNLVKYYNACYQEDNLGTRITNIFAKSIENRLFISDKDEIVTGFLPYSPIDNDYAEKTAKKIVVSSKEKELVYCSLFLIGNSENKTHFNSKICSPLIIYPAKIIKKEDDYFVEIDKEHRRINFSIFNELIENDDDKSKFNEDFFNIIDNNNISLSIVSQIAEILEKYTSNIDTSNLLTFPELMEKSELQSIFKRKAVTEEGKFYALPVSALAVIKKTVNTRGIINELNEISKTFNFSAPLKTIFAKEHFTENNIKSSGFVPAILNSDQQNTINVAENYPFSTIIGPPGTGKSYTISALAIEKISQGKSVLITASTDKAVDVIANKIENQLDLKNLLVRAGNNSYKKDLLSYINSLLRSNNSLSDKNDSKSILKDIKKTDRKLAKIQQLFQVRIEDELKWGKYISKNKDKHTFFVNLKKIYIEYRNKKAENHWNIEEEMQLLFDKRNRLINSFIKRKFDENIKEVLTTDRATINTLIKALKTRNGVKQLEYFMQLNYKTVFKIFPIWLVKMSDIYKTLPLIPELFDFVIIDEATQSNVSQAIPVLQRGKHALITGDFKQLRHFSFLSETKQNIFRNKFNTTDFDAYLTNYRANSLLDIISQSTNYTQQFTNLFEHYRSLPAIINFSNNAFYDNKLRIMTSRPDLPINMGIDIINCNGERDKKGVNIIEAEKVLDKISEIIEAEKDMNTKICSSIGVLSPFRAQIEYISLQITQKFSYSDILKHQISINTAYGFQGDERDIMLISFSVDNKSHASAFRYLNKNDVFNVSITRARKMQYIFHSINIKETKYDNILRRYLESFETAKTKEHELNMHDEFLIDVKNILEKENYQVWQEYKIAGLNIDLVIKKNDKVIGLDLIGFPGQFENAFTVERYKMLHRAGLDTFPLPYTYWKIDKVACLKEIEEISSK